MAEFARLEKSGFMTGDTDTLRSALRILKKNGLIRVLAAPKLITMAGREASLRIGRLTQETPRPSDEPSFYGTEVDVTGVVEVDAIRVDLKMRCSVLQPSSAHGTESPDSEGKSEIKTLCKIDVTVLVPEGETVVLGGPAKMQNGTGEVRHTYLVLTASRAGPPK